VGVVSAPKILKDVHNHILLSCVLDADIMRLLKIIPTAGICEWNNRRQEEVIFLDVRCVNWKCGPGSLQGKQILS
jgi:hypothetical protein